MMNSVMATISSLILLLVLSLSACQASLASAVADAGSSQAKHSHNQVEQQQQQQQKQSTSRDELVGQLLKLATPTTGDEGASSQEKSASSLEDLLTRCAKKQQLATKPSKRRDEHYGEKGALKRKWHKLMDEVFESGEQKVEFAVSQPQARKRNLLGHTSAAATSQDDSSQDERLAVILIKRKPQLADEPDGEAPQPALGSNNLADLMAAPPSAQQQQRAPVNMAEHQRRLNEDGFGILRQSKFTTNNHLGTQGVPKFGSDEQF